MGWLVVQHNRKVPAYCRHKASGQAVVRLGGRDVYLGPYGSPESRERYTAAISEWQAFQSTVPQPTQEVERDPRRLLMSVSEVLAHYQVFAKQYYSLEGRLTKEYVCQRDALRPLRALYGSSIASEFGPLKLKALRQHLIDQGLCRKLINSRINRIRRFFKWAVGEELIPPAVFEGLRAVDGLRFGRTAAKESPPIRPVDDFVVEATLKHTSPQVATMIRLQRLTGMRPGEVVLMRGADIDRDGEIWIYEPLEHKNRWRGHQRQIPLGPQAQRILLPFLDRAPDAFLFSPIEAEAWRNEQRSVHRSPDRKTKIYPCELRTRDGRKQAATRRISKRPKQARYNVDSYRRAIVYAIKKSKASGESVSHWHPNQLRHTRGTEIRRLHGIEAAQMVLGHAHARVTEVYAERNLCRAVEIARLHG